MVRGPKKHLKRLHAPKNWMLDKLGGIWAPKPSAGPHKSRESLPLVIILRNRLKYALTKRETNLICMQKLVKVDGKVRTDLRFPTGFQDVVTMEKSNDQFRVMYDSKGRFALHPLNDREAKFKLCRITKQAFTSKAIPYIVTHDGRTIRYHDPIIKKGDTVKLDIETGKVIDVIKFEVGNLVMITHGRNTGRVGVMYHRDRHPGSFDICHIRDAEGNEFATRIANVFVIGKGDTPACELPRGQGIKRTIFELREKALRR
eukprot:CAMPEP_0197458638 /NCGR_PEP_ID=MMETSP1175-20131217/49229_1 /TAXON_ID=1003142 /ORGANISM="Triceratium dubium, Strain CCMP147" /LENGTH=258 /DNA_ID=CAMNT_0042993323 /DNA_START=24 /DNA_END=800 /DNA_ORIENTATION=-